MPEENASDCGAGATRVVVVDDEPTVRELIARIVAAAGYIPHQAENAVRAIELLESHAHETCLVISDVVMEGMNGLELAELVRATYPHLPVLLVTGYAEHVVSADKLPDGVVLRAKPFNVADLRAMVERACETGEIETAS